MSSRVMRKWRRGDAFVSLVFSLNVLILGLIGCQPGVGDESKFTSEIEANNPMARVVSDKYSKSQIEDFVPMFL